MNKNSYTISEFSRMTGINSDNLRFYDRAGLLVPERREENGYRSYSRKQLSTAYLISTLRSLDVGLEEIKEYATSRNPEVMKNLFKKHDQRINQEIARLKEAKDIMEMYLKLAEIANIEEDYCCKIEELPEEKYFICQDIPENMNYEEAEIQSFQYAWEYKINLVSPLGVLLDVGRYLKTKDVKVMNYYFKTVKGKNAVKPAGKYAIYIGKEDPTGKNKEIEVLLNYIKKKNLQIIGNMYIEYVLDHVAEQNIEDYVTKIEVQVR